MINVMRIAQLYEFFDSQKSRAKFERSSKDAWKTLFYIEKREFEQNLQTWVRNNATLVDRIVDMCDVNIQQLLDFVWIAKKTWNYLKKRYLSQDWFHKWFVLNRLKQINYVDCKNVTKYEVAYKNILKEIKDLNISMKNTIIIKMFNNLN